MSHEPKLNPLRASEPVSGDPAKKIKSRSVLFTLIIVGLAILIGAVSVIAGWLTLPWVLFEIVLVVLVITALRRGHEVF